MKIGIPTEIKNHEYRVGATPGMVRSLVDAGHSVAVQSGAGEKIGFTDAQYEANGALIVPGAKEAYDAEMVIKVKELQTPEFSYLHEGQILFCYLHLAPDPIQTQHLIEKKVVAIAYETVTDQKGRLPLLIPMSEIAGRISIQAGALALQMNNGGKGLLLGGVPGVFPAHVTIVGGGVVGTEAARMALGLGAEVTVLDRDLNRLRELDLHFGPRLHTLYSSKANLESLLPVSDLIIGSVLIPGKSAPKLISRDMLKFMEKGSVIVDVAIDQGGFAETSRPTTHDNPLYTVDGILHYCVTNMPGACAKTATEALANATTEYALMIANKGWKKALKDSSGLKDGLNVCYGHITNEFVAQDLGYPYAPPEQFL